MPRWGIGIFIGIFDRYNSLIAWKPRKYAGLGRVWVAVIVGALPSLMGV